MKKCPRCDETKSLDEFWNYSRSSDGKQSYCKSCTREARRKHYRENKEKRLAYSRAGHFHRSYGITVEEYDQMLERQNGVCAICDEECPSGQQLAVDHCHETGRVRGLLCCNCNRGVGLFKDKPKRLLRAAEYLEDTHSGDE